jgi:8-amino-7-oxononanoate synthase
MDIFEKCFNFTRANEIIEAGIYPYFMPISENSGPTVVMNGKKVIMIGSNNYLGLTQDPRVIEASVKATEKYGTSCSGSRFLNGTLDLHLQLEEALAKFTQRESALIFSTGFMSNLGAIPSLVDRNDIIIMDKANHASIYSGTIASIGTELKRYKHNNMDDLEKVISAVDHNKGLIIVTDGVFSMEGDIAKLQRLTTIAKEHNARVYVDEAHGMGVLGKNGRGASELLEVEDDVDIVMSTFSKSFGSIGGFVAGPAEVIGYIKHKALPLIFSAAPTPAAVAAVIKSLEIIQKEPQHKERLQYISDFMRKELVNLGFDIGDAHNTPIIPIYIRNDEKTFLFWTKLFENGVFANAVISPAVPPDQALLRTSYMASLTDNDLDKVLDIMKSIGKEMDLI